MLTAQSLIVSGPRNSGKSMLIDIAKLTMRDLVIPQSVFLFDSFSSLETNSIVKSIE